MMACLMSRRFTTHDQIGATARPAKKIRLETRSEEAPSSRPRNNFRLRCLVDLSGRMQMHCL